MPSDIIGTEVIEEDRVTGRREIRFIPGPMFANVILADEINRTPPKTQAALLEAMQEYQVTVNGVRYRARAAAVRARDAESDRAGRHLSAAGGAARSLHVQRRHRLPVDGGGAAASSTATTGDDEPVITPVATAADIEAMRHLVRDIPAASNVIDYALRIVRASRPGRRRRGRRAAAGAAVGEVGRRAARGPGAGARREGARAARRPQRGRRPTTSARWRCRCCVIASC